MEQLEESRQAEEASREQDEMIYLADCMREMNSEGLPENAQTNGGYAESYPSVLVEPTLSPDEPASSTDSPPTDSDENVSMIFAANIRGGNDELESATIEPDATDQPHQDEEEGGGPAAPVESLPDDQVSPSQPVNVPEENDPWTSGQETAQDQEAEAGQGESEVRPEVLEEENRYRWAGRQGPSVYRRAEAVQGAEESNIRAGWNTGVDPTAEARREFGIRPEVPEENGIGANGHNDANNEGDDAEDEREVRSEGPDVGDSWVRRYNGRPPRRPRSTGSHDEFKRVKRRRDEDDDDEGGPGRTCNGNRKRPRRSARLAGLALRPKVH